MYCENCGKPVQQGEMFCENCGNKLTQEMEYTPAYQPEKKIPVPIIITGVCVAVAVICVVLALSFASGGKGGQASDGGMQESFESAETQKEEVNQSQFDYTGVGSGAIMVEESEKNEYQSPTFNRMRADSTLDGQYGNQYNIENITDSDATTAWVEGVDGDGIGQSITFIAEAEQTVSGIRILNGYNKNREIYSKNNRVKKLEIVFPDGTSSVYDIPDEYNSYCTLNTGEKKCKTFTIRILEVYNGTHYSDTAISEIEIY